MKYVERFQLNIRLPDGATRPLAVRGRLTIAQVLAELGIKGRLFYKAKELPLDATLESLGISEKTILEVHV